MGFKIKANIDTSKLKALIAKKQFLIQRNIRVVLKDEAVPFLIARVMEGYDDLSERAAMNPDDPTNPANWRSEFFNKLRTDLEDTFIVTGNRISVRIGDTEYLGYTSGDSIDPSDTTPLHWMVFFLEGLIGDWAFISPETYSKLTRGSRYDSRWGRFSAGFMVSKQDYEEQGWNKVIPFEQVRHPFSGFSPLDIFEEALREFNLRPFIQKAIDAAVQGRKL